MNSVWRRRPSPAMVVAIIALIVALSGTAIAATTMIGGDKLIKPDSLSGNRLRKHTIGAAQVNLRKLGTVPSAQNATSATTRVDPDLRSGQQRDRRAGLGYSRL